MNTSTTTQAVVSAEQLDEAREVIADALTFYVNEGNVDDAAEALAAALADNVHGWTHTTRLREFLERVNVQHAALEEAGV